MTHQQKPLVTLRKETPPPSAGRRPKAANEYADTLAALQREPGEWFAVLDYGERTTSAAGMAKKREQTEGYEFVGRVGVVYGRYLNGTDSAPPLDAGQVDAGQRPCPCVAKGPVYSNLGPDHDGSPDYCPDCDDTGVLLVPPLDAGQVDAGDVEQ